jgi:hypothetical protein
MDTKTTFCLVFLALSPALAQAEPRDFEGKLYRHGSQKQELLFTLQASRSPALWVEHYKDARGSDAVIERTAFVDGKAVAYEFDDHQRGGLGKAELQGQELLLSWTQDGKTAQKREPIPDDLILGPLYVDLLRQRWDDLMAGRTVEATVPVLSRDRLMTATLAFRRAPKLDRDDGTLCLLMKPANWFVALFFPPIQLHFEPGTRRLVNMQGRSLLREKIDGEWEMTDVDLDYN